MKKKEPKVAILIPAYNEADVLDETLCASLELVAKKDIYIVDDGSSDDTAIVARQHIPNVLTTENKGKAHALNAGIRGFQLVSRYDYIFLIDADSRPKKDFLTKALVHFQNDIKGNVICVSGQVRGTRGNWLTQYRQWEYRISYLIHKQAQEKMSSILVTPGCATVYRSSIFKNHEFPSGTLTEDMDFTFYLHRNGYKGMVFEHGAIVYTIDPQTLRDFMKQILRWYTGFWQVVRKHDVPWGGQMLDLEVAILALEGLYNGALVVFLGLSLVNLWIAGEVSILLIPFLFDLVFFFLPTLVWSAILDRDYKRLFFIPHFYLLRLVSSIVFLVSYFRGFFSQETQYVWDSNRVIREEVAR